MSSHPSTKELSHSRSTGLSEAVLSVAQRGPLNTSGMEQDAGFAQEDLTIYDGRDKPEVEGKMVHS